LTGNIVAYGVYFWWYRIFKSIFSHFLKTDRFTSTHIMLMTAAAGVISSLVSNPIWMLNTRLAIRKKEAGKEG